MSDHQKGVKRPQSWNVLWAEALCEQDVELTVEKKNPSEQSGVVWLHRLRNSPEVKP